MNVYELDEHTLRLLYEDVTDANRAAHAADFLRGYNQAYAELQRTKYRPCRWEQVTLRDRSFTLTGLSYRCAGVVKVSRNRDYDARTGYAQSPPLTFAMRDPDTVVLPNYDGESACVQYLFRYPDLENAAPAAEPEEETETNTPQIPQEAHILLALTAAADEYRRRRQGGMADEMADERVRILRTLHPYEPGAAARRARNLYGDYNGWK